MNELSSHNIGPLLDAYLSAGDTAASDGILAELVSLRVEPVIVSVIRSKLHVTLRSDDERQVNQDALDLASDVKTLIVAKLSSLKSQNGSATIDNLEAYIRTVAANAANQFLRKKHPNRLRLKNQVRYLLTHDRRFSLWVASEEKWVCGERKWQETSPDLADDVGKGDIGEELKLRFVREGIRPNGIELVDVVRTIFDHVGRPLRFADLVSLIYELRRMSEPVDVLEEDAARESSLGYESNFLDRLEHADFLRTLWDEITRLPLRHRAALLLNLRSAQGEGMITLLPLMRVATIRQIAGTLEFPTEDFVRIWNDLPWDDNSIAEHLGLTRQQVINLRQSARATLRRRLEHF